MKVAIAEQDGRLYLRAGLVEQLADLLGGEHALSGFWPDGGAAPSSTAVWNCLPTLMAFSTSSSSVAYLMTVRTIWIILLR
jgi:hypothetical protein